MYVLVKQWEKSDLNSPKKLVREQLKSAINVRDTTENPMIN